MTAIAARPSTKLRLSTGESLEVAGTPDSAGKLLQDAVRSSPGTLAWLQDADSDAVAAALPVRGAARCVADLAYGFTTRNGSYIGRRDLD